MDRDNATERPGFQFIWERSQPPSCSAPGIGNLRARAELAMVLAKNRAAEVLRERERTRELLGNINQIIAAASGLPAMNLCPELANVVAAMSDATDRCERQISPNDPDRVDPPTHPFSCTPESLRG